MTNRLQKIISHVHLALEHRPRPLAIAGAILFALALSLYVTPWPSFAGFVLGDFNGVSTESTLELRWFTLSETDISRWDIYCKDESQPALAYHPIGTQPALGVGGDGAAYSFPVPELTPNVSYCFRLIEVNSEGVQGQSFDRCGWGLNITPTPTPIPPDPAGVVGSTPVGSLSQPISGDGAVPLQDAPTSSPTPTEVQSFPTPTATQVGETPLQTNTELSSPDSTSLADTGRQSRPIQNGSAVAIAAAPTVTPTADPGYVVVTATPTSEIVTASELSPTFTPLPTATSEPIALIDGFGEWRSEDLVLASLCFVFFGAGGLGVLGITSLSLYLRSRSEIRRKE